VKVNLKMLQKELLGFHVKMATYEDKMNKNLLIIYRNLVRNCGMFLHLPEDLLELLLEVEFRILDCALLDPIGSRGA
jgi:hypothetical protein